MSSSTLRGSIGLLLTVPLLGCPHVIYAIPTLMNEAPRFPGPEPVASKPKLVPVSLRFQTEGHFLLYRLRVDGKNLEPSAGTCRRWFMRRGAREAETARRAFCSDDAVRFYLAVGVPHTLELLVGSEHTVAKRAALETDRKLRWRMPITTARVELSITPEHARSYTVRGGEEGLHLRSALSKDAPKGTKWDVDEADQIYYRGVEVGSLWIEVLRGRQLVSNISVPLYSGRMKCEPPFCEAAPTR